MRGYRGGVKGGVGLGDTSFFGGGGLRNSDAPPPRPHCIPLTPLCPPPITEEAPSTASTTPDSTEGETPPPPPNYGVNIIRGGGA